MAYSLLAMYSHKPIAKDTTPMDWSVCVCVCGGGGGEEGRGGEEGEEGRRVYQVFTPLQYTTAHN